MYTYVKFPVVFGLPPEDCHLMTEICLGCVSNWLVKGMEIRRTWMAISHLMCKVYWQN
jgi:hypothetical protein